MNNLPQISNEEFDIWLRHFLEKDLNVEADMVFIDLFLDGSPHSPCTTLSKRIRVYVKNNRRRRRKVLSTLDSILDFLIEKGVIKECDRQKERSLIMHSLRR